MPSGLIQHQDHMHVLSRLVADKFQVMIHVIGIDRGGQQCRRLPGGRIHGTKDIDPFIFGLFDGRWSGSFFGPDVGQGSLLSDSDFVLEPDLEVFAGVLGLDVLDKKGA